MVVHEACIAAMEHGNDYDLDKLITDGGTETGEAMASGTSFY